MHAALAHLDLLLCQRRVEELAILLRRDGMDADVQGIQPHRVQGRLIAPVFGVHKAVVIAHLKLPSGNQRQARRALGGLGAEEGCAAEYGDCEQAGSIHKCVFPLGCDRTGWWWHWRRRG